MSQFEQYQHIEKLESEEINLLIKITDRICRPTNRDVVNPT